MGSRRADADREMIGPRKRPEVARLLAHRLDDDGRRRGAPHEVAGGHRKLAPGERPGKFLPHDAVRPVRADDAIDRVFAAIGLDDETRAAPADIDDSFRDEPRAGGDRRIEQRAIEHHAAHDDERGAVVASGQRYVGRVNGAVSRGRGKFDGGRPDDHRRQRADIDGIGDEREGAPRESSATGLFARMAWIEQGGRRTRACQVEGCHRPRRARADDGDRHISSQPSADID